MVTINPVVPAIIKPSELAALATEINEAHKQGESSARSGLEHFRKAGDALLKVKEQVGHGHFGTWLKEHVHFSQATANYYMRVSREWDKLQTVCNLRDALRVLIADESETDDRPTERRPPAIDPQLYARRVDYNQPPERIEAQVIEIIAEAVLTSKGRVLQWRRCKHAKCGKLFRVGNWPAVGNE